MCFGSGRMDAARISSSRERRSWPCSLNNSAVHGGGALVGLRSLCRGVRACRALVIATLLFAASAVPALATDQIYFSSSTNVTDLLVQRINAENVRIDMSCWYLTEHSISIAL